MLQTSVEIVKPGGTGRPAFVISASPDPLPPSRSFILRLPSALPDPKKYTCFLEAGGLGLEAWTLPEVRARLTTRDLELGTWPFARLLFFAINNDSVEYEN